MEKPFSPACERNRGSILDILRQYIKAGNLLEVGSGTGQHAVYFAREFPELKWVCSDGEDYHYAIKSWMADEGPSNIHGPLPFLVGRDEFPMDRDYRYVFTANTLHIMSWDENKEFFRLLSAGLKANALVFIYGPFNYNGSYTSEGNKEFDLMLKERSLGSSSIRNFEDVQSLMQVAGFYLIKDHEMPANNRLLVYKKL